MKAVRCVCGYVYYPDKPSYKDVDNNSEEWNQPFSKGILNLLTGQVEVNDVYICPRCKTIRMK